MLQLERRDVAASQTLRAALSKVEAAHPGFTYDLVVGIMRRGDLSINMNESVLRLQGTTSESDGELCRADFYSDFLLHLYFTVSLYYLDL
jgi:hypothetical protein